MALVVLVLVLVPGQFDAGPRETGRLPGEFKGVDRYARDRSRFLQIASESARESAAALDVLATCGVLDPATIEPGKAEGPVNENENVNENVNLKRARDPGTIVLTHTKS